MQVAVAQPDSIGVHDDLVIERVVEEDVADAKRFAGLFQHGGSDR